MSDQVKKLFSRLAQVGVVVRDLDASIKEYNKLLGMEPSRIIERSPTGEGPKQYYGKESEFFTKIALYNLGDIELELLQPLCGESVLQDFLAEHGEGLQHIAFDTEDFEGVSGHFEKMGIPMVQTGPTSRHPLMRWGYFDTSKTLGFMLEVFNASEIKKIEEAEKACKD